LPPGAMVCLPVVLPTDQSAAKNLRAGLFQRDDLRLSQNQALLGALGFQRLGRRGKSWSSSTQTREAKSRTPTRHRSKPFRTGLRRAMALLSASGSPVRSRLIARPTAPASQTLIGRSPAPASGCRRRHLCSPSTPKRNHARARGSDPLGSRGLLGRDPRAIVGIMG
jgi:hypothetical protein